jgi:hypothetical protein
MAILDSLPGVSVAIWSNGSKLTEYDDLDDEVKPSWRHKTTSKYVESESDAEFFFNLQVGYPYEHDCDDLGFFIYIDGCEESDGHLCGRNELDEDGEWETDVRGIEIWDAEGPKVKKFRFSNLNKSKYSSYWNGKETKFCSG